MAINKCQDSQNLLKMVLNGIEGLMNLRSIRILIILLTNLTCQNLFFHKLPPTQTSYVC